MKTEMGWVLQHIIDCGYCRDPVNRLAWRIGNVGFPIHESGDRVEWEGAARSRETDYQSKNSVNGRAAVDIPGKTPTL